MSRGHAVRPGGQSAPAVASEMCSLVSGRGRERERGIETAVMRENQGPAASRAGNRTLTSQFLGRRSATGPRRPGGSMCVSRQHPEAPRHDQSFPRKVLLPCPAGELFPPATNYFHLGLMPGGVGTGFRGDGDPPAGEFPAQRLGDHPLGVLHGGKVGIII